MKWFQHLSSSHTNLKLEPIIKEFGMEGYGFWWLCLELVALQGKNFRIRPPKNWKDALKTRSHFAEEKIEKLLHRFSEINLISRKSLTKGIIYIPKLSEYCDDYTDKVRRVSEQSRKKSPT